MEPMKCSYMESDEFQILWQMAECGLIKIDNGNIEITEKGNTLLTEGGKEYVLKWINEGGYETMCK